MQILFESADSKLFGITIFLSILAFQVAYILLQWYYIRRVDFLWYVVYMLSAMVYVLGEFEPFLPFKFFNAISPNSYEYLKHTLALTVMFLYFRFQRYFLNLPQTRPSLNTWVIRLEFFIMTCGIISPLLLLMNVSAVFELYFFCVASIIFGICTLFIIARFLKKSNPFTRFAMLGSGFMLAGAMITLFIHFRMDTGDHFSFDPYLPFLIFFVAELLTFTTGLSYKTRMIEFEKAEQEKSLLREIQERQHLQIQLLNVRTSIARDLHDEIGSGLSKISLLGEVMKKQGTQSDNKIESIIISAKEMMQGMADMIWSLNSNNDTLDNLISHLRHYAVEYFEHSNVELSIEVPEQIPSIEIVSHQRRALLMMVKEAFNNVLKHSKADKLCVRFELNGSLLISIHDNGVGLKNIENLRGNGLKNMKARMEELKGKFEIENGDGTRLIFHVPLPEERVDS